MRILHARLPSAAPERAARFFRESFGFAAAGSSGIVAGHSRVDFHASTAEPSVAHYAFNVPFTRFDEVAIWCEAITAPLRHGGRTTVRFEAWRANAIYFRDADGHIGEFIGREALAESGTPADESFTGRDALSLGEVAIVVDDVPRAVDALGDAFGIRPYGTPSDVFAAVGDERGLIILVCEGRSWFPTEIAARPTPVEVSIDATPKTPARAVDLGVARVRPADAER